MHRNLPIFTLILLFFFASCKPGLSQGKITLDEDFSDWNASHPTFTDGLDNPNGIDLIDMQVTNDDEYLYVKFSIDKEVCLGNTLVAHTLWLSIDADNNPNTGFAEQQGYGTELAINFNGHYAWFNVPNPNVQVSLGDIGLQLAPTVTSSTFEVAIPRDIRPDGLNGLFTADTIRLAINEDQGNDRMPDNGSVFTYVFNNTNPDSTTYLELLKDDPTHIRAVSFNVLRDNAWSPAGLPRLERIVKALGGDLFCFQESGQTSTMDAKAYFDSWLPLNNASGWYAYKDGGGRLTCSRWPISSAWNLNRKNAMLIDLPASYPRDLLLINAHLSCCTNNQGRQEQVDEFASFFLDAKSPGGQIDLPASTPMIFLGDMNFVGFRQQLETVLTGDIQDELTYGQGGALDWDGTNLSDARPLHIDSNLVFTWRDLQGDGFPPGRLDFQFYTDAVLDQKKSFVLQTEAMTPQLLASYQLQSSDTEVADHLPLVVDYAINSSLTSNEKTDVGLKVYPNPGRDVLFIETEEKIEGLRLLDLAGREVLIETGEKRELNLAQVSTGIYVLEVRIRGYAQVFSFKVEVK